jgi:hypothetical protein
MNREEWLNAVADRMAPWYEDQGYALPYRDRLSLDGQARKADR